MLNVERRDDQGRVVHFHAFRKTFQTFGARAGIGQRSAQAILGHSDPSLTANVYTDEQALALGAEVAKLPWIDAQLSALKRTERAVFRPVGEILRELVQAAKSLGDGELIGVGAESRWLPSVDGTANFLERIRVFPETFPSGLTSLVKSLERICTCSGHSSAADLLHSLQRSSP